MTNSQYIVLLTHVSAWHDTKKSKLKFNFNQHVNQMLLGIIYGNK